MSHRSTSRRRPLVSPRSHYQPTLESLEHRLAPTVSPWQALIGLDTVQSQYPYKGDGYSVAVLDTGIDYNNPNLGGGWGKRVIAGYDFVNNDSNPMDDNGHGTFVAGMIGGTGAQDPGVAPDVNLIALKVLDANADGSWTTIDQGLQWVIAHRTQYHIVAINMSLGSGNYTTLPTQQLESDLSTLVSAGVFISVASGNGYYTYAGQPGLDYPAVSPNVVSVGAVWAGNYGEQSWSSGAIDYSTAPDRILSITQRSSALDLLAPGAWVTSDWLNNTYQTLGGTSMSAAVVTGAAVLLHQAYDTMGESALTGESSLLHLMQSTGITIVDGAHENDNVPHTGLSFNRLDLAAAMHSIQPPMVAPTLAAIATQTLPAGGSVIVPLTLSAGSTQGVVYSAQLVDPAATVYALKQQLGLQNAGYTNLEGANEKWLTGTGGYWYALLPNGQLRRWAGDWPDTLSAANLIATLDVRYYQNLSLIYNATQPSPLPVTVSVNGNQLTIRSTAAYIGSFTVQVTATSGGLASTTTFQVNEQAVAPPTLQPVASQTVVHDHALTLALAASDTDGNPITFTAGLVGSGTPATLAVNGNQLTVTPAAKYVGSFQVQVTARDGSLSTSETFTVNVTDAAPVISALPAQTLSGQTLTLPLPASDADGDSVSFSAQAVGGSSNLTALETALGLMQSNSMLALVNYTTGGPYYKNLWGGNEEWLLSTNGYWYCILPDGSLYRWSSTFPETLQNGFVANLGSAVYNDPSLLWTSQAGAAPPFSVSVQGNQLTLTRTGAATGSFTIQLTATDGIASTTSSFTVNVTAPTVAPTLAAISAQTLTAGQTTLTVPLTAGSGASLSAQFVAPDANLYQLDQQLGLSQYNGSYFANLYGAGDKWLVGKSGQWYLLMPTGALYGWSSNFANTMQPSHLIANVGTAVYAEPRLLWQALPPSGGGISVSVQGGQLVLTRPAGLQGVVTVQVKASNGQGSATQTFVVTLN